MAAGFASAAAAFVTSRFGVAGTLLGAALTTMIITGGSAILKAYLESVTGNVRKVPRKLRERRNRWKAGRMAEPPDTMPGRPDLRDNFAGRMRAALGWFSHLPPLTRRSILIKGLIAAAVAFVVGMAAVTGVELGVGKSLSCWVWEECPARTAGGGAASDTSTRPSILGGSQRIADTSTQSGGARQPRPAAPERQQAPPQQNPPQQNPPQQAPSFQRVDPGRGQPPPSDNEPGRGIFEPDSPVEQEAPAQPGSPNSASPAPEEQELPQVERDPARDVAPSDASPAPSE